MDFHDLLYGAAQESRKDIKKSLDEGTAGGLMKARVKQLDPTLWLAGEGSDDLFETENAYKGARSLEEGMPNILGKHKATGAAVVQFLPQAASELAGSLVGGTVAKGVGKVATKLGGAARAGLNRLTGAADDALRLDPHLLKSAQMVDDAAAAPRTFRNDRADLYDQMASQLDDRILERARNSPRAKDQIEMVMNRSTGTLEGKTPAERMAAVDDFREQMLNPARREEWRNSRFQQIIDKMEIDALKERLQNTAAQAADTVAFRKK